MCLYLAWWNLLLNDSRPNSMEAEECWQQTSICIHVWTKLKLKFIPITFRLIKKIQALDWQSCFYIHFQSCSCPCWQPSIDTSTTVIMCLPMVKPSEQQPRQLLSLWQHGNCQCRLFFLCNTDPKTLGAGWLKPVYLCMHQVSSSFDFPKLHTYLWKNRLND